MIPWLLGEASVYAQETPQDNTNTQEMTELEARLLGNNEESILQEQSTQDLSYMSLPNDSIWLLPFAGIMLALVLYSKWKKNTPISPGEIRVPYKLPMGREGSLAIIEVGSDNGQTRRLLVGLHDHGAPRLISALDTIESFDSFLNRVDEEHSPSTVQEYSAPKVAVPEAPVLQDRKDLLSEIYQARGIDDISQLRGIDQYRKAANDSTVEMNPNKVTSVEVQEDEDPWAAKFRMIYNEKTRDE